MLIAGEKTGRRSSSARRLVGRFAPQGASGKIHQLIQPQVPQPGRIVTARDQPRPQDPLA